MKLQEIRKQRKMSQAKLAEKLGVSRSTVSMWEIGASQPDNDNLLQLAQILNISLDVLLGNDASSAEDASYVLPVQIKRVPLLGNIACGEPIFAEEEHGEYIYTSDALDVDFCLRLREKGWRIVWTPYAELYHHESKSRGSDEEDPAKKARFAKEQARLYEVHDKQNILHDPYYNPNLSLDYEDFRESGDLRNLKNVTL